MNYQGIIVGIITFIIIGIFHPIVVKLEYYVGKKAWPVFLIGGMLFIALSLIVENVAVSAALGVTGFSSLWSIHELHAQEERVKKGWFPGNPHKRRVHGHQSGNKSES